MTDVQYHYLAKSECHDIGLLFLSFASKSGTVHINYELFSKAVKNRDIRHNRLCLVSSRPECSLLNTVVSAHNYALLARDDTNRCCPALTHILSTNPSLVCVRCAEPYGNNHDVVRFARELTNNEVNATKTTLPGAFLFHALHSPHLFVRQLVCSHFFAFGINLFNYPVLKSTRAVNQVVVQEFYADLLEEIYERVNVVHPLFPIISPPNAKIRPSVIITNKQWRVQRPPTVRPKFETRVFVFYSPNASTLVLTVLTYQPPPAFETIMVGTNTISLGRADHLAKYRYQYTVQIRTRPQTVKYRNVTISVFDYELEPLNISQPTTTKSTPAVAKQLVETLLNTHEVKPAHVEDLGAMFSVLVACHLYFDYVYGTLTINQDHNGVESSRTFVALEQQPSRIRTPILLPHFWYKHLTTIGSELEKNATIFAFAYGGYVKHLIPYARAGQMWIKVLEAIGPATARPPQSATNVAEMCAYSRIHYFLSFRRISTLVKRTASIAGSSVVLTEIQKPTVKILFSTQSMCLKSYFSGMYSLLSFEYRGATYTLFVIAMSSSMFTCFSPVNDNSIKQVNRTLRLVSIDPPWVADDDDSNTLTLEFSAWNKNMVKGEVINDKVFYTNTEFSITAMLYRHVADQPYKFMLTFNTSETPVHQVDVDLDFSP